MPTKLHFNLRNIGGFTPSNLIYMQHRRFHTLQFILCNIGGLTPSILIYTQHRRFYTLHFILYTMWMVSYPPLLLPRHTVYKAILCLLIFMFILNANLSSPKSLFCMHKQQFSFLPFPSLFSCHLKGFSIIMASLYIMIEN